ncbi:MAG: aldo/keto reductase [Clostridiaceae bacterium]|nr:aldo/keto reductase [Clostridiaceae bacterium]
MRKIILGNTGLEVTRVGFGALPIQRVSMDEAKRILIRAYESGINFFDTARAYSDSEEKIGNALSDVRKNIIIATKTNAKDTKTFWQQLETSLENLKTDYIDIYQFHNPKAVPMQGDELYDAMLQAKQKGLIRHIGITNHSFENGKNAVLSGLYETLQYPFNHISSEEDLELVTLCKEKSVGFIAMKALSGGLITNAETSFCYLWQYPHVVPIWGIQRINELEQFIELEKNPPVLDETRKKLIEQDKKELSGSFCRGCGYCMPCPVDIPIPTAARMKFLLRRAPYQKFVTKEWQDKMELIGNCIECNQCSCQCPYHLDTPALLKEMLEDYREFVRNHA